MLRDMAVEVYTTPGPYIITEGDAALLHHITR